MISDDKISFDSDNKVDTAAVVRTMWGGRITIAISATVCTVLALAYALQATPLYRSEISVIEVSLNGNNGSGALASELGWGTANGPGHESQAFLKSRRAIEEFVKSHDISELYPQAKRFPTRWLAVRHFQQDEVEVRDGDKLLIPKQSQEITVRDGSDGRIHTRCTTIVVPLGTERFRALRLWQAVTTINYNLALALLAVRSV